MFKSKKLVSIVGIASMAFLVAPQANAQELNVVSTFSIISDFAKNVGGERIALTTLVGPDGDSHTYEPKPADAQAVGKADVVLTNGLHLEGFIDRLIRATDSTAPVITLTDGVKLLRNNEDDHHRHENHDHDSHDHDDHAKEHTDDHDHATEHAHHHHHGEYDPHAWQSVRNAQVYVNNIAQAFCAADQDGCSNYQANAASYNEKLQSLDADLKASMEQIPADKRMVITSHDAFAYLGDEYGLQFLASHGLSTEAEPSAASVASLIQQIKDQTVSAIFLENITNPMLIEQIASETNMKIGGKLYSDALSAVDGPAPTYIDMMQHNINTIRNAVLDQ